MPSTMYEQSTGYYIVCDDCDLTSGVNKNSKECRQWWNNRGEIKLVREVELLRIQKGFLEAERELVTGLVQLLTKDK